MRRSCDRAYVHARDSLRRLCDEAPLAPDRCEAQARVVGRLACEAELSFGTLLDEGTPAIGPAIGRADGLWESLVSALISGYLAALRSDSPEAPEPGHGW
jgi:hypothetical protein